MSSEQPDDRPQFTSPRQQGTPQPDPSTPDADTPGGWQATPDAWSAQQQPWTPQSAPTASHVWDPNLGAWVPAPQNQPKVERAPKRRRMTTTPLHGLDAPVTAGIILANVIVWVIILLTGGDASPVAQALALSVDSLCETGTSAYAGVSASACTAQGGQYLPGFAQGAYWQLITSAFTHIDPIHIGLNMLSLWFVGRPLEIMLGKGRYSIVYVLSALAGSLFVVAFSPTGTMTLGASGAIFGLLGALLIVAVRNKAPMGDILFWLGINLLFTFTGGNISWQAHIGGLIGGAAVTQAFIGGHLPLRTRRWIVIGIAVLIAAGTVACAIVRG